MKLLATLIFASAITISAAIPAKQILPVHAYNPNSDVNQYAFSICGKAQQGCIFTNVIIACDRNARCTEDTNLCTVWEGKGHGAYANCT